MASPETAPEPSWWKTLNTNVQNHLKSLVADASQPSPELRETVVIEAGIGEPEAQEFLNWYFDTQVEKSDSVKTEGEEKKKPKKKKVYNDELKNDPLFELPCDEKIRVDPDYRQSVKIHKNNNQFVIIEGKHGDGIDVGMGVLAKFEQEGIVKYVVITPGFCVTYKSTKGALKITEVLRLRIPKLETYNKRPKAARSGRTDFRFEYFMCAESDVVLYPYYSHFGSKCQACFNFAIVKVPEEAYGFIEENCNLRPIHEDTEKIVNRAKIFKDEKQSFFEVCGFPGVDEHSKSYELFSHTKNDMDDLETGMDSKEHGALYYSNSCTAGQAGSGLILTYENVSYLAGMHVEVDFNTKEDYGIGCMFTGNVFRWIRREVFDGITLPSHYKIGAFVELHGLKSAKGKGLNGLRGTIHSQGKNSRWGINLVDGKEVAIKEANLLVRKSLEDEEEKEEKNKTEKKKGDEEKVEEEEEGEEPKPISMENLSENQKRWLDDMMKRGGKG